MTTLQEAAMRKALEALKWLKDAMTEGDQSDFNHAISKCFEAIEPMRTALAQQACKYGQTDCTATLMDCQCAIDAALAQQGEQP